ncbi:substrate-binding domain-containing protein [Akkermansiaceae bacterium]|nr:substrate-binding domain-containing protein [Akkermansiaceae bacterium]
MKPFRPLSSVEQLAGYLREEIRQGGLGGRLPGINRLAASLGCSANTVHAAMKQLEREGFLLAQGAGRCSRTALPQGSAPALRVKILLYERQDAKVDYISDLRHRLQEAGHSAGFATKSLLDLGMDAGRVAGFVAGTEADAWIVVAGSRTVLEWFAEQSVPAFALFGRQPNVPIAGTGPYMLHAVVAAVRRLAALGHSRIVCLTREERRKPGPGLFERAFLEELRKQGIAVGPYNLPDWEDNPEGFHRGLKSLFGSTPPTAIIADGVELFLATQQFFLQEGIRVPNDVSMVCSVPHPAFAWSIPSIAHMEFDSGVWVRNVERWVSGVANGKNIRRKHFNNATFSEGGTVGPAKA